MVARKHLNFVKFLVSADSRKRKERLARMTNEELKCLAECVRNVMTGNIRSTNAQQARFKKHRKLLTDMALGKYDPKRMRKNIVQRGGSILPTVLALALPALIEVLRQ
jgi:uncharacterized protein with von Willebrand factor type A (vWA) domain